jgi:D-alanine--poly(phosphoribitol) ligase subunit 1
MFTSGSSGTPKGVKVSNANVNQYLGVMLKSDIYDFKKEDKFLQAFELTFDASVQWIFAPLSIGACIYVPEENKSIAIADAMAKHCLTVAMMVPSTLYYLQPYFKELVFESIRYFFAGGEALSVQLLKAWKPCVPNAIVENLYGPTEATIWCTRYRVDLTVLSKTEFVSIGKPNPGIEVLILDENNEEVVDKKKGQLCVYGKQVVEGYIDSSENGAFVVINKKRYYGTGDLVYVDEQQNLNYCGRIDNQIKMNGYRIEPEEIEKEIFAYCGLVNVVVAKSLAEGHLQIVAYIENFKSDVSDLKTALRLKLPDYMIPSKIISIPKMPLNANGKMDRNAILNIKA